MEMERKQKRQSMTQVVRTNRYIETKQGRRGRGRRTHEPKDADCSISVEL
jgi:hypothetical protein